MYLFKILIIQVIQLLVRSSPELSVSTTTDDGLVGKNEDHVYERKLIDTVTEYYIQITKDDLLDKYKTMTDDMCSYLIDYEHLQMLENCLLIILRRMFNHYQHYLVSLDHISSNKIIELLKSEYVETICTHLPRCLDFVYICTPMYTNFKIVLGFHSDICASRKIFLTEYYSLEKPSDVTHPSTIIENKRVTAFCKPFLRNKTLQIQTECLTESGDVSFVKNIFEIVNKIDKTFMISNSPWEDKSILDFYFHSENLEINLPQSLLLTYDETNADIQTLNQELKDIIFDKGQIFLKTNNNEIINVNEKNTSHNDLVCLLNDLLLQVMWGFEYHFRKGVSDFSQNDSGNENQNNSIDYDTMKNIVSLDVLQEICKQVPLILYYLASNDMTINDTLFSLYLTLCSDWIYFLNVRCECDKTENGEMLYNMQCVKQSIEEKIFLNQHMVLRTMKIKDKVNFSVLPEKELLESIIQSIYDKINKFYFSKDIYVWPTFEWLSGIHILTETYNLNDINEIKQQIVRIDYESILIFEMYNQLLPWNLNIETILGFHRIIEMYVMTHVGQYVWRQANIIKYYFEHTDVKYINDEVFQRLKISTQWYRSATSELSKVMNITDGRLIVPKGIRAIIKAIENVEKLTINDISNVLKLTKYHEKYWIEVDIVHYNTRADLLNHLSETFLLNCYDALSYVNKYFTIIKKSKLVHRNIDMHISKELCENQNQIDVFVGGQNQIRKYSEMNDKDYLSEEYLKRKKTVHRPN